MTYKVKFSNKANKIFKKIDRPIQKLIISYLENNLEGCENPRAIGKALVGNKKGLWRYRIGNYRLICEIKDYDLIILIINLGHRRDIYK
ncbi:type II toxin-antitoxin system RelE/ParE family toxin [Peptoniphilus sp. MSJ-1]|uniref:Type II toxin-antitoxin system RelE/ParE family toxin n=1 Tax=Peptoniphilus ovalis TaxID=2841503 RepID=A0ABS6FI82_9FIRM|nr:type II toxin-antitoxin system RelE/ParE family toxin [Peptoniphilus ovalis]MBU5669879.1 type II toxin-antitoxin system RelE/ParE family toxin [Peptoniphilus ovalis]